MWSRILEDQSLLTHFISENQKRLAKHYKICIDILTEHKIPYYPGGNAGLFIWVDMRNWLLGERRAGDFKALKTSSRGIGEYRSKESVLSKTWLDKGVMIANGSAFYTEELGWFRIVFTAEEAGLRLGLQRFVDGLQELKQKGEL